MPFSLYFQGRAVKDGAGVSAHLFIFSMWYSILYTVFQFVKLQHSIYRGINYSIIVGVYMYSAMRKKGILKLFLEIDIIKTFKIDSYS